MDYGGKNLMPSRCRNQLTKRDSDDLRYRYRFVWVSCRRDTSRAILAACEQTGGDAYWGARPPRLLNGVWMPARWVVSCLSLSLRELTALERTASRIDPTALSNEGD
jgi:hypothetical protein